MRHSEWYARCLEKLTHRAIRKLGMHIVSGPGADQDIAGSTHAHVEKG
jgi:hypothetical protein